MKQVPFPSAEVRYLMPHFPIINLHKTSTPVRVVMDCKVELNKHLLAGPNLLNDVVGVLLRFRSGLFTFSGDIKKMFLRIFLDPADRPYHCFLWKNDKGDLEALQFQVHVFGNAGSPFLAVWVLKEHAQKYAQSYPQAVEALQQSTLIDDVLDSVDDEEEARKILLDITKILAEAGMEMAKYHSNSLRVLGAVPRGQWAPRMLEVTEKCTGDLQHGLTTLGIEYDAREDTFTFRAPTAAASNWTKRKVLKLFPRLYDPLGFLLPFTVRARIYFSSIAGKEQAWDKVLPPSRVWEDWVGELSGVEAFTLPRCIKTAVPSSVHLHIFADASEAAYAAAAYLVCTYAESPVTARLVAARAHVAPNKKESVPRLELRAAELGVRLRAAVLRHLKNLPHKIFHWSDSITVLYWLRDDATRFQPFVANRLQKIRAATEEREWSWVPSGENPADLATRGLSISKLRASALWKEGPPFLKGENPPVPPKIIPPSPILAELRKAEQVVLAATSTQEQNPLLPIERFSSLVRLYSLPLALCRWRDRARRKLGLQPLSTPPWARVERNFIFVAQAALREQLALAGEKKRRKNLGLLSLPPFLAEDGLIRGQGRLRSVASLPRDMREPILLPRNHPYTKLQMLHAHQVQQGHSGGTAAALNRFLERFWSPHSRRAMYSLVNSCVACRRRLARPRRPPPAPLPSLRIPPEEGPVAFDSMAFDCAGPYRVKRGRTYELHYMLLATCCQTRAVRLEVLSSLSLDSFWMAFSRLNHRGVNPKTVLSDNGTNFVGANRLLQHLWGQLKDGNIEKQAPKIKWLFNPPYASHYGGVFERLIGAAKSALYHALPSHFSLTLEQLYTAFAEVEGLLNARPLCYVSGEAGEVSPLTPNHFLAGAASLPLLVGPWEQTPPGLSARWRLVQEAMETFRTRFMKEVLPHMRTATAKRGCSRDLKEGDVVTFLLPSASNKWPLALVHRTFPGKDGRVRTIELWKPHYSPPLRPKEKPPADTVQPIGVRSVVSPPKQPISGASVAGEESRRGGRAAGGRNERGAAGAFFKRDVGTVALLLPVEETTPSHI